MIALTPRRGTSARTATQSGSASGAIVGDSNPGVIDSRVVENRTRAVVVQHQVLLAEHHALHPRDQLIASGGVRSFGGVRVDLFDQDRL